MTASQPPTHDTPQQHPHLPGPQPQHAWLQQLVGDWTFETEASMGPDQPTGHFTGTERVRALGDVWIIAEGEGELPDGDTGTTQMTLGYDRLKGCYVGTFIGSMMAELWVYAGELDETGRVLTLSTEGPSMEGDGTLAPYRDIIEIIDGDQRVMTSHVQGADGQWRLFMTARYQRVAMG